LITSVTRNSNGYFSLKHKNGQIETKNVIVATGPFHIPYTPAFHTKITEDTLQVHSNYYKSLSQLNDGDTLVVGAGDSGYQILDEVSIPQPVIGTDVDEILGRENVIPVGRTKNALGKDLFFDKAKVSSIKNIIWATGYKPNFKWIEGLEFDKDDYPKNYKGVSNVEGVYFIGLPWMFTRGSATLGGVSEDAEYLAGVLLAKESA
jgi:putative flavoprotein involved in K+ transport